MNSLEQSICKAVKRGHAEYEKITQFWLFHAPEHFLQNYVFLDVARQNWEVYPEATRRKISEGMGKSPIGRPPSAKSRYDLVVWNKDSNTLRAVVEIKRCLSASEAVKKDAARLKKALSGQHGANAAYLLLYSEIKIDRGCDALVRRFREWAVKLDLTLMQAECIAEHEKSGWICGYSLMRARSPSSVHDDESS